MSLHLVPELDICKAGSWEGKMEIKDKVKDKIKEPIITSQSLQDGLRPTPALLLP